MRPRFAPDTLAGNGVVARAAGGAGSGAATGAAVGAVGVPAGMPGGGPRRSVRGPSDAPGRGAPGVGAFGVAGAAFGSAVPPGGVAIELGVCGAASSAGRGGVTSRIPGASGGAFAGRCGCVWLCCTGALLAGGVVRCGAGAACSGAVVRGAVCGTRWVCGVAGAAGAGCCAWGGTGGVGRAGGCVFG